MTASMPGYWVPSRFRSLHTFSREEMAAYNAVARTFRHGATWQTWVTEGLAHFFQKPAGFEVCLCLTHTIDSHQAVQLFRFRKSEIRIGRAEGSDLQLPPRSVGHDHARVFVDSGDCYIEDLGSPLGTFLNETKLAPHTPAAITDNDRFSIFPYALTVEINQEWEPETSLQLTLGELMYAGSAHSFIGKALLEIVLHPGGASFLLETSREFLEQISNRLLAPLSPEQRLRLGLTPVDTGFFELLVAAVLERANRDLPSPLEFELFPKPVPCSPPLDNRALAFSFAIRVGDMAGVCRLWIKESEAGLLSRTIAPSQPQAVANLPWLFPISAGQAELSHAELCSVEIDDVILLSRQLALLFPNSFHRGWHLSKSPDNLSQAMFDNYFEEGLLRTPDNHLDHDVRAAAKPDLTTLPVHLHAIIGEKEFTLAEAMLLTPGVIIELDSRNSGQVRIALNGKVVGLGELVEIEERLGIRVVSWSCP